MIKTLYGCVCYIMLIQIHNTSTTLPSFLPLLIISFNNTMPASYNNYTPLLTLSHTHNNNIYNLN